MQRVLPVLRVHRASREKLAPLVQTVRLDRKVIQATQAPQVLTARKVLLVLKV